MSEEIIQLPDFILAELYKDCIVELGGAEEKEVVPVAKPAVKIKEAPADVVPEKPLLKYLGENKKHIVALVHEIKALIINEDELDFLSKILTACQLNLADIAIVNTHNQQISQENLQQQFGAETILLLGVEPSSIKLPFNVPYFQVQPYAGSTYVYTPPLAQLLPNTQESKLLKSKLWLSLKSAFKI